MWRVQWETTGCYGCGYSVILQIIQFQVSLKRMNFNMLVYSSPYSIVQSIIQISSHITN